MRIGLEPISPGDILICKERQGSPRVSVLESISMSARLSVLD